MMRKITVAVLLFPRFQLLDLSGPCDAFAEVQVLSQGECVYEILTIGTTRGPIRSSSGIAVTPDRSIFDPCPHVDTVLVPGGLGVFDILEDTTVSDWLQQQQSRACRRLCAVCNGGFALGAAGLLAGKVVSTHWMDVQRMAAMFPSATIRPDHIYVKDGPVYTTAGVTAGIDLSLLLIEEDFGRAMALAVAKYLIVYLRRAGGQSQFSPLLEVAAGEGTQVAAIQAHVLQHIGQRHSVESLAAHFGMSVRHLARIFAKGTGMTLLAFLNDARIDTARRLLENTDLPLKEVAARSGVPTSEALRRLFLRRLEIGPQEYRQRFRSVDAVGRTGRDV